MDDHNSILITPFVAAPSRIFLVDWSEIKRNGTPELAYGITDWWELGFDAPFAVDSGGQFLSNGGKIRNLFVTPSAANRNLFYGVNFEFSYETPPFSQTRYALEIRPMMGVRNADWEFIVNPIVDVGFGALGEVDFLPAVRLARNLGHDRFIGIEYYSDLGQIGNFLPLQEQRHQLLPSPILSSAFSISIWALDMVSRRDRIVSSRRQLLVTPSQCPARIRGKQ